MLKPTSCNEATTSSEVDDDNTALTVDDDSTSSEINELTGYNDSTLQDQRRQAILNMLAQEEASLIKLENELAQLMPAETPSSDSGINTIDDRVIKNDQASVPMSDNLSELAEANTARQFDSHSKIIYVCLLKYYGHAQTLEFIKLYCLECLADEYDDDCFIKALSEMVKTGSIRCTIDQYTSDSVRKLFYYLV